MRLPRMPHVVEPAILGAAEKVGHAVAVEVDGGRTDVVTFDVATGKRAGVAEHSLVVALPDLHEQVRVGRIDEDVELAVAVPVDDCQLAPAAAPCGLVIEPQRSPRLVDERFSRGMQRRRVPRTVRRPSKQHQIALGVEHGQVGSAVAGEVVGHRRGPPLRQQRIT